MFYTADDERIGEMISRTLRWKLRDVATGLLLREFVGQGIANGDSLEWTEDCVYGGTRVAGQMDEYWGGKRHFHLDHLGSVRMITNDARMRHSRNDFYPFGAEQSSSVQEATNFGFFRSDPMKFTGHDREYYGILNVDNSDYIDYMHARFYSPNTGRFLSVDPVLGDAFAPQSWNGYAYVENAPLTRNDPDGMMMRGISDDDIDAGGIVITAPAPSRAAYERDLAEAARIQRALAGDRAKRAAGSDATAKSRPGYRAPDYYAFTVNAGTWIGATVQLIVDRYGRVYWRRGQRSALSHGVVSEPCRGILESESETLRRPPEELYNCMEC
jgi:RHS repeat-associated protein